MVKISNHMKKIIPLKPGNILGVCAPSARFDTEKLNKGIQVIKDLGFGLIVPDKIFKKKRYLAGDDILRANIINGFFSCFVYLFWQTFSASVRSALKISSRLQ